MQSRQKFTVFFFLQPCGYLSPHPCTKSAMNQNSTTCTLVANLIVYLELHLLCALIILVEGVLEVTKIYREKAIFAAHCILRGNLLCRLGHMCGLGHNIKGEGLFLQLITFRGAVCCMHWATNNLLYTGSHCKIPFSTSHGLRML
jgi:hypothetical protein